jgi:hypothetical protein
MMGEVRILKNSGELVRVICELDDKTIKIARLCSGSFSGVFATSPNALSTIRKAEFGYDDLKNLVGKVVDGCDFAKCGMITAAQLNPNGDYEVKIVGYGWVSLDNLHNFRYVDTGLPVVPLVYTTENGESKELTEEQYALLQR